MCVCVFHSITYHSHIHIYRERVHSSIFHSYIYICIFTYIHTYIYIYIYMCIFVYVCNGFANTSALYLLLCFNGLESVKPCFGGSWYWLGNVIEYIKYCICSLLVGFNGSKTDENWSPNRLKILQNRRPGVSWTRLGSFFGSWRPLARISLVKLGPKWAKLAPSRQQKAPEVTQDGDLSLT